MSAVYPRLCGGTPANGDAGPRRQRSIPACAGEPPYAPPLNYPAKVYPRLCGGTRLRMPSGKSGNGLSPPVRGNHCQARTPGSSTGSIPACAGEPTASSHCPGGRGVYPRLCGGTDRDPAAAGQAGGLSPPVRGNPPRALRRLPQQGSIPACAGEPSSTTCGAWMRGVYPRLCGGTMHISDARDTVLGLSPPVRGNRCNGARSRRRGRSIPACAGEPLRRSSIRRLWRVYPRLCGGTCGGGGGAGVMAGLSPPVRGNRSDGRSRCRPARSIPACAGEPSLDTSGWRLYAVYPRLCGGTIDLVAQQITADGLSPPVRGNRAGGGNAAAGVGSIPACAGEPPGIAAAAVVFRVYPRLCGGTDLVLVRGERLLGLSPPVRGNRAGESGARAA